MSDIPSRLNPRWREVALGNVAPSWKTLSLKLMMMRIVREAKDDPSNVAKYAGEIYEYFRKNGDAASADLAAIFK